MGRSACHSSVSSSTVTLGVSITSSSDISGISWSFQRTELRCVLGISDSGRVCGVTGDVGDVGDSGDGGDGTATTTVATPGDNGDAGAAADSARVAAALGAVCALFAGRRRDGELL